MEKPGERELGQAVLFGLVLCFVFVLVLDELALGALGFFLGAGGFIGAKRFYEKSKKKSHAKRFEKDLPFALMEMAVQLNLNTQIEKVIENITAKGYGVVSREFSRVLKEMDEMGCSVGEAIAHLSERIDSLNTKRALYQLINLLEQGAKSSEGGEPLKRIAREMLLKQRSEAKAFGNKLVVFSLVFIAISAIIPALFQAFIVIGTMFLELEFTAVQVLLIIGVGFPLIDLIVLGVIRAKTPLFLRE